jgi:hypothetical protein
VIVAMGVLAIGATAAFALLVAAAAAGARAQNNVNAALIAETVLNDTVLEEGLRLDQFPVANRSAPAGGGQAPAAPAAGMETRLLEQNATWKAYPDYTYDVAVTPLESPEPGKPWSYLIEVEVRWSEKGRRRSAVFSTVRLKTLTHRLNPAPSDPAPRR